MSRRPTDWSPLAGSDPVPGDPDEVERAARSLADMAEEITRQTANLTRLATAEGWDAEAGRTFADSAGELSGQLGKAHGRYATAAGALRGYAPELRHAQSVADAALAEAKQAQVSVDANRPPDYPPAGSPTAAEVSAERQRQYAYEEGVDALNAARRKLTDATDHRDEHAGRAARTIRNNIDQDGLKGSWWDEITNWVFLAQGRDKVPSQLMSPGSGDNSGDGFTGGSLGLHQSAWCAAQGPLACAKAMLIQRKALQRTNELADQYNWSRAQRNAFRHSYWMGLMTVRGFSYDDTVALGEAHEKDTDTPGELPGSKDSNADLHNNATGARIGVDVRPWHVALLEMGATDEHEKELEERLIPMLKPVCTEDGSLQLVE